MHGERKKVVVTLVVMRHFFILPDASRACADFCDPSAVSRFTDGPKIENAFRAYNLSPEDWELVQTLFVKARQNLAHREKDFHAVFANHRSGMPGGKGPERK